MKSTASLVLSELVAECKWLLGTVAVPLDAVYAGKWRRTAAATSWRPQGIGLKFVGRGAGLGLGMSAVSQRLPRLSDVGYRVSGRKAEVGPGKRDKSVLLHLTSDNGRRLRRPDVPKGWAKAEKVKRSLAPKGRERVAQGATPGIRCPKNRKNDNVAIQLAIIYLTHPIVLHFGSWTRQEWNLASVSHQRCEIFLEILSLLDLVSFRQSLRRSKSLGYRVC